MAKKKKTLLWRQIITPDGTKSELYQPGFDPRRSFWLDGSWIKVPNEGFFELAAKHAALYADLDFELENQWFHEAPTDRQSMTEAQRQAFEHYSGLQWVQVILIPERVVGTCRLPCAGDKAHKSALPLLKKRGDKVISNPDRLPLNRGMSTEEVLALGLPAEYLYEPKGK